MSQRDALILLTTIGFLAACSSLAPRDARAPGAPEIGRSPSNSLNSQIEPKLPAPELASACLQQICGPRHSVETPEKLLRRMKNQTEYRKSEFFKKMDARFADINRWQNSNTKKMDRLFVSLQQSPPENSDRLKVQKLFGLAEFLPLYQKAWITRNNELKAAGKYYSLHDVLDLSPTSALTDDPDGKKILARLYNSEAWPGVSESFTMWWNMKFTDFENPSSDQPETVAQVAERLRRDCVVQVKEIAKLSNLPLDAWKPQFRACFRTDPIASREEGQEILGRLATATFAKYILRPEFDSIFAALEIAPMADRARDRLAKQKPPSECHGTVATEWNLANWPTENKTLAEKVIDESLQQTKVLLRDISATQRDKLFEALGKIRFQFPDRRIEVERRILATELPPTPTDAELAQWPESEQILRLGLINTGSLSERYCDAIPSNVVPDAFHVGSDAIVIGAFAMHTPQFLRSFVGHEIGHAVSSYLKFLGRHQTDGSTVYYYNVPARSYVWESRACLNTLHQNTVPFLRPDTDIEGRFTEEDFADRFSALLSIGIDKSNVANPGCAFEKSYAFRPKMKSELPMIQEALDDLHSPAVFRAIHWQKVRNGVLPNACQDVLRSIDVPACFGTGDRR